MRIAEKLFLIVLLGYFATGCASGRQARTWDDDTATSRSPAGSGNDVFLGMSKKDVIQAWGEPHDVETAGNVTSGNERWVYYEGLSNPSWNVNSPRVVYFENGRVAGWKR